jgi:hypothetical protein
MVLKDPEMAAEALQALMRKEEGEVANAGALLIAEVLVGLRHLLGGE